MRTLGTHLRFALRTLRRTPAFSGIAIVCLAVGIGATTTMVEVVDLLLFRPPPHVRAPRDVVQLHFDFVFPGAAAGTPRHTNLVSLGVSYGNYLTLRDSLHALETVAGYHTETLSLGRGAVARPVTAAFVSGTFFPLLGVQPAMGQLITADGTGADGAAAPAVISYTLWQTQFGGDPSILGHRVTLGKGTYTLAGITPRGIRGVELLKPKDIWVPIGAAQQEEFDGNRQAFVSQSEGFTQVIGRLRPDVSSAVVTAQAAAIVQAAYVALLGFRFGDTRTVASLTPVIPGLNGEHTQDVSVALWLTGVAAIVLLIACANVAGLLLVRAADRRREVVIRLALGATRGQLAQLFLVEGVILAAVGGVLGLVLRQWGGSIIRVFLLPQLHIPHGAFDARILGISALVTLATGIVCGIVPALHTRRRDIAGAVVGAPRDGGARQPRVRAALLVGQVALAMALVAGAALFITSWRNVRAIELGFSPQHVLVARMPLESIGYTRAESRAMYDRMLERVRALPGVRSASIALHAPFVSVLGNGFSIPGVAPDVIRSATRIGIGPELYVASPAFFSTMGITLRDGRLFDDRDRAGTMPVAIINEAMARKFWPNGPAVGQCITIDVWGPKRDVLPCSRIVGVVADTKSTTIRDDAHLQMYAPLAQREDLAPGILLARTNGDPAALVSSVRRTMQSTASGLPYANVKPMAEYLEPQMRPWRLGASMFTLFGAVALGLATVGLYGVFSYAVARRTREMGIRAALGARAGDLLRLILFDGLRLTAVGVVIGLLLAIAVGRVLAALLVGVSGATPALLGVAAGIVLLVTALAVSLPARRAASVDPVVTLREE
jgi:predicted permease